MEFNVSIILPDRKRHHASSNMIPDVRAAEKEVMGNSLMNKTIACFTTFIPKSKLVADRQIRLIDSKWPRKAGSGVYFTCAVKASEYPAQITHGYDKEGGKKQF